MQENLAFLVPFHELAEIIRQVAAERNEKVTVYQGLDNYPSARQLENMGTEAIITRGHIVNDLRKQTSIPVIGCNPSGLDLVKAFAEAKNYDNKVGMINTWDILFDKTVIETILGISIHVSPPCYSFEEIYREISAAASCGLKVVVGGTVTFDTAPKYGLKCVKLFTDKEAVIEAIEKAKEIVRITREKRVESEQLKIILDLEQNGMLSINEEKIVTVFNRMAEKITGIKKEEIIGYSIEKFPVLHPIVENLISINNNSVDIVKFRDITAVNKRVPIIVNDKVVGVVATYQQVNDIQEMEAKIRGQLHKKGFTAKTRFDMLEGESDAFKAVIAEAKGYADNDFTILIEGETGTGKGLLAQCIHLASKRANGPFVAVNCSALPESLLESELFGYAEGAFTGARRRGKLGLFELAHKGTIFLDEIAGATLHMQSRLLRVVEEKETMRVGGDEVIPLDVRIIAASNHKLLKASLDGGFRLDLFYRLNVLNLILPPLRERKEDIIPFFRHFLQFMKVSHKEMETLLNKEFCTTLHDYTWPGNVRELEHIAKKAASLLQNTTGSSPESIRKTILKGILEHQSLQDESTSKDGIFVKVGTMEEMETELIRKLYVKFCGNKVRLAKKLNISRTTLWKKIENMPNNDPLD